jgi:hypothetical protein
MRILSEGMREMEQITFENGAWQFQNCGGTLSESYEKEPVMSKCLCHGYKNEIPLIMVPETIHRATINIQEVFELVEFDKDYVFEKIRPPFSKFIFCFKDDIDLTHLISISTKYDENTGETEWQGCLRLGSTLKKLIILGAFYFRTDKNGSLLLDGKAQIYTNGDWDEDIRKEAMTITGGNCRISVIALYLIQCKNISFEDYDPMKHISRQQRRDRERKNRPLLKYQILHINPMSTKVKTRKPATPAVQPGIAAHAVRGHFMTFTKDHPAFGQPWGVGTFWCGPYVCGNPAFGLNLNDYHIEIEVEHANAN